jgi:hypothetical protein
MRTIGLRSVMGSPCMAERGAHAGGALERGPMDANARARVSIADMPFSQEVSAICMPLVSPNGGGSSSEFRMARKLHHCLCAEARGTR